MASKDAAAPAAKPAAKPKAKKPKGSAAPAVPMEAPKPQASADLSEADAKSSLDDLQQKYAALVVNFNNQQTELKNAQAQLLRAENELEVYRSAKAGEGAGPAVETGLKAEMEKMAAVRAFSEPWPVAALQPRTALAVELAGTMPLLPLMLTATALPLTALLHLQWHHRHAGHPPPLLLRA